MSRGTELSPTMQAALDMLDASSTGTLKELPGGFWTPDGRTHTPGEDDYTTTGTIRALESRRLLDVVWAPYTARQAKRRAAPPALALDESVRTTPGLLAVHPASHAGFNVYIVPADHMHLKIGYSTEPQVDRAEYALQVAMLCEDRRHRRRDALADAQQLVHRWNMHEQLVEALRLLWPTLQRTLNERVYTADMAGKVAAARNTVDAAIEAAKAPGSPT